MSGSGTLYLCGTPIGNLEDVTLRLLRILGEVDLVAAEDTRRTRKLLTRYGISARLVSYHARNETRRLPELLERLKAGRNIAAVSDAGMPGLSDPGHRLVSACIEEGIPVDVVPGPSAAVSALVISGLKAQSFLYLGFPPRRPGSLRRRLEEVAGRPETLVAYESPVRVEALLEAAAGVLGDRRAALARELTKVHQEVRRGRISELISGLEEHPVKGEVVLVIEGAPKELAPVRIPDPELKESLAGLMKAGYSRRDAARRLAAETGLPRKDLYRLSTEIED